MFFVSLVRFSFSLLDAVDTRAFFVLSDLASSVGVKGSLFMPEYSCVCLYFQVSIVTLCFIWTIIAILLLAKVYLAAGLGRQELVTSRNYVCQFYLIWPCILPAWRVRRYDHKADFLWNALLGVAFFL